MSLEYKVKNGFAVHHLLQLIDVDYLFSKSDDEDYYKLLNIDEFGKVDEGSLDKLKERARLIVIHNDTLVMEVHNIEEEEMNKALMEMG